MLNDYQEEFRLFLKKSRENMGLTQESAALSIGVSVTTLQNWENKGTKPDDIYLKNIVSTYELRKDVFLEKYNNLVLPMEEENEKPVDKKLPWPNCMPLSNWLGEHCVNALKNLYLNSDEIELLGMQELFSVKGKIDLNVTDFYKKIKHYDSYDDELLVPGTINIPYLPESYIRTKGVFNVLKAKKNLGDKLSPYSSKTFVLDYLYKNPNVTRFSIYDMSEKEFLDFIYPISAISRKTIPCKLGEIIEDTIKVLKTLEKHNDKYCIFDGEMPTEIESYKHEHSRQTLLRYKKDILFENDKLYTLYLPRSYWEESNIEQCKKIYKLIVPLFKDLLEIVEMPIEDNLEYLEYQNKLKFYEENKDKGAIKPEKPKTITGLYIVPTKQGKDFLRWYKENIEEK